MKYLKTYESINKFTKVNDYLLYTRDNIIYNILRVNNIYSDNNIELEHMFIYDIYDNRLIPEYGKITKWNSVVGIKNLNKDIIFISTELDDVIKELEIITASNKYNL